MQAVNATLDSAAAVEFIDTTIAAPQSLTEIVEILETSSRTDIALGEPAGGGGPALDPLNPTEDDAAYSLTQTLLDGAAPGAQLTFPEPGLPPGFSFNQATGELTFDPGAYNHLAGGRNRSRRVQLPDRRWRGDAGTDQRAGRQ